jgi:hypothetical protein
MIERPPNLAFMLVAYEMELRDAANDIQIVW